MPTVLIPYENFPDDLDRLPRTTQRALQEVLEYLWANPYHPALMRECEAVPDERYAYPLPGGYVFYWKVESESAALSILPPQQIPIKVYMTAIRKL